MLSAVRLIRGSSYNVGNDFEIFPTDEFNSNVFFSDANCLSRFARLQLFIFFFFFLKLFDSATSDVPSSITASHRTNREVSGEVDHRVLCVEALNRHLLICDRGSCAMFSQSAQAQTVEVIQLVPKKQI